MIPDFITHYYLPDRKPFLNLWDLSPEEMAPIVNELNQRSETGKTLRAFPDWYFPQRTEAEINLRKAFIEKGGKPERKSPHYFTLGRSKGFEWLYKNEFKTIEIPLSAIESEIYFSIGDTLWTFAKSHNREIQYKNQWFQGKLYNYDETIEIISDLSLDLNDTTSLNRHKIFCIESFIWSDAELKNYY